MIRICIKESIEVNVEDCLKCEYAKILLKLGETKCSNLDYISEENIHKFNYLPFKLEL